MKICIVCGKEIKLKGLKGFGRRKTCSDECSKKRKKQIKKIYQKEWLAKNRDKFNKFMRRYYQKNKEKYKARNFHGQYREKILKIHKNKCDLCGSKEFLEIHHIDYNIVKKIDRLEFWRKNNLEFNVDRIKVLCKSCHKKEHK